MFHIHLRVFNRVETNNPTQWLRMWWMLPLANRHSSQRLYMSNLCEIYNTLDMHGVSFFFCCYVRWLRIKQTLNRSLMWKNEGRTCNTYQISTTIFFRLISLHLLRRPLLLLNSIAWWHKQQKICMGIGHPASVHLYVGSVVNYLSSLPIDETLH